jgi:hypothetical protein
MDLVEARQAVAMAAASLDLRDDELKEDLSALARAPQGPAQLPQPSRAEVPQPSTSKRPGAEVEDQASQTPPDGSEQAPEAIQTPQKGPVPPSPPTENQAPTVQEGPEVPEKEMEPQAIEDAEPSAPESTKVIPDQSQNIEEQDSAPTTDRKAGKPLPEEGKGDSKEESSDNSSSEEEQKET